MTLPAGDEGHGSTAALANSPSGTVAGLPQPGAERTIPRTALGETGGRSWRVRYCACGIQPSGPECCF